jgi:hypothetical protein
MAVNPGKGGYRGKWGWGDFHVQEKQHAHKDDGPGVR